MTNAELIVRMRRALAELNKVVDEGTQSACVTKLGKPASEIDVVALIRLEAIAAALTE